MSTIEQRRKMYSDFQAGAKRDQTNRFAAAGRFLLYVGVAPILLVAALIAVAVLFY